MMEHVKYFYEELQPTLAKLEGRLSLRREEIEEVTKKIEHYIQLCPKEHKERTLMIWTGKKAYIVKVKDIPDLIRKDLKVLLAIIRMWSKR